MRDTTKALRDIELFAALPERDLERVAAVATRRVYQPGETIFVQGDPCRTAFFVAAGQVRVYRISPGGREQVLAMLEPGQALNTVPVFHPQGLNHANAQAATKATLYAVTSDDLLRLVGDCPQLALALLRDFAARLYHLTDLVEDLSLRTVRGRMARFLLEHADAGAVSRRWTQEEIASHLGTVRDVIGRALRALAKDGLVRMDRQRIILLDRERLEEEAQS